MPALAAAVARLEETFRRIERERMCDMPLLNPALRVEAIDFRAQDDGWLGALITPWFINLVILPRDAAAWDALAPTATVRESLPMGECEFLVGRDEELGTYKSCALFSPALEFEDQEAARATARAALDTVRAAPTSAPAARESAGLSRRAFLRGEFRRTPP
ncbi:hypothetical protein BJI67_10540 [Acidihalobacter aeolianus]|uniref:[NiFe]-hydrogenase assembly, chaperone, HybE n=1 Tax=Acidihalobacter aeolianus TaxID=2792603 RepID=A0A1D8K8Z0_9GAMM|nr:[NiFe]-hydrogenase assembly chaperone HybE [Acidihalobacter aeolianus]AOV17438.1 hypothetical protein BJI67_10540 [Acidihalobacter aeolianus]